MKDLTALLTDISAPESNNQGFNEFIPFESTEPGVFPVGVFPIATAEFILRISECIQAPLELVGTTVLGALEIACNGRYPVRLPNGHSERPCLYLAPIAQPSERKSGVIDVVMKPLIEYEMEYNQAHSAEISQSKSELKMLMGRIAGAEQTAIKEKDYIKRQAVEQELRELNSELAEFEPVEPLRLFSADVTPEKLAAMLKAQREKFALVSAEGGGLFENIGRYSEKGGLEIYLNGYSGDRITIDRKSSDSIIINKPTLNMIAPCQPSVIADLFSDKQKSGRGLLSRILYVKCRSRVGGRKAVSIPLDSRIEKNYKTLCYNALSAESTGDLKFDADGFAVYANFFEEIEVQLTPDEGELTHIAEWAGKLPGTMVRLAGLIHCINAFEESRNPLDTDITAEEAAAAVKLARFYLAHAKLVYGEQSEPPEVSNAKYLWERIKSLKSLSFKKVELTRKVQNKVKDDFDYEETLQRLINNGYINIQTSSSGRGRPTETIYVNPESIKNSD